MKDREDGMERSRERVRACIDTGMNSFVQKVPGLKTRVHATSFFAEARRKEVHEEVEKVTLMFHTDCGAIKVAENHAAGKQEYHPIIMQNWINPLLERTKGTSNLDKQNAKIQTELAKEIYPNADIVVRWIDLVGVERHHSHFAVMKPSTTSYSTNLFTNGTLSRSLPGAVKLGMMNTYISQLARLEDAWTDTMIALQPLEIARHVITYSSQKERGVAETFAKDLAFAHSNDAILRAKNPNIQVYVSRL